MIVYNSVEELAAALKRAEAAHAEYEKELGYRDENWQAYYATYMAEAQQHDDIRRVPEDGPRRN